VTPYELRPHLPGNSDTINLTRTPACKRISWDSQEHMRLEVEIVPHSTSSSFSRPTLLARFRIHSDHRLSLDSSIRSESDGSSSYRHRERNGVDLGLAARRSC
jgi:hypothetical protein